MSRIWLAKRKRKCLVCGSSVKKYETLYNSNWRVNKHWFKCEHCGFLQSFLNPRMLSYLESGAGGAGGVYEWAFREYYISRLLIDKLKLNRILIHGAGWTDAIDLLRDDNYDVYGCDVVPEVINKKKKLLGKNRFFHKDNYPKTKFDGIVSVEVFEHLINPIEDTKEILSHLKDTGVLAISTDFFPWKGRISDRDNYGKSICHVSYWSEDSIKELANQLDYKIKIIDLILPPPSEEDPASLMYNKDVMYPNRKVAFFYKDNNIKPKLSKLPNVINIPTHDTQKGMEIYDL